MSDRKIFFICSILFIASLSPIPQLSDAHPLDNWHLRTHFPAGTVLCRAIYAHDFFWGVGWDAMGYGVIYTSSDGISWTKGGGVYGTNPLRCIAYGNSIFVVGGAYGSVLTSPDGITWTERQSGAKETFYAIAYGNNTFVAVGESGGIFTSPDGITWNERESGTANPLYAVAYGNDGFVAGGRNSGHILTSPDGITWTTGGYLGIPYDWYDIIYANNTFVGVGQMGTIFTSPDGVIWTSTYLPPVEGASDFYGITYGSNTFVAVGQGRDSYEILISHDGITWTRTKPGTEGPSPLYSVTFGNNTFVAFAGNDSGFETVDSPDGLSWTARGPGTGVHLNDIAYGNNTFVAVGGALFTSIDGITWTEKVEVPYVPFGGLRAVAFGNNTFVAVGENGIVLTSSDGISWSETHLEIDYYGVPHSPPLLAVAYGNNTFIAHGDKGDGTFIFFTSQDAITWTERGPGPPLKSIIYANATFIAVGRDDDIFTSPDGITWTKTWSMSSGHINSLTFGDNRFVAVGVSTAFGADGLGLIVISPDAITWTPTIINIKTDLYGVVNSNHIFVAVGTDATILTSFDGIIWEQRQSGMGGFVYNDEGLLRRVTYGNDTFIAVGTYGTILQSDSVALPPAPTLISPNGTIRTTTATYIWNAVPGSTWYYLWVDDSTGNKIQQWFTSSDAGCPSGTGTCSITSAVSLAGGACTWKVQTWSNAGYGSWSSPMSFTVYIPAPPPAPIPASPSGTITTITPTYTWNAVSTATDYNLWVSDSSGVKIQTWFTATQAGCASGTGNCSVTPATVLNPGAVQWWVQAKNSAGTSPWSAPISFTVQIPLGTATPLSPAEGSTITTSTPTYTWTAVPAATWYYLSVDDPTGNRVLQWCTSSAAGCGSGTGNCSVIPATTLSSGACKWKVQTWNSGSGYGPWSSQVSFTVNVPEPKATLVSPSGTITTATPTYIWNAVPQSTWYNLSVDDSTGNKILQWYTAAQASCGSGTGECSVTPSTALAVGAATWKVQTWVNAGTGPWSTPMSFTVNVLVPPGPPVAPNLISPLGTITTTTPSYTWNAVSTASDYYLWVNDSSGNRIQQWYTAAAAGCSSGTGTCSVTPTTSLNIGAGQWWVQAKNSVGVSSWSAPLSFTVALSGTTLVSPSGTIPTTTPSYTWNAVPGSTWYNLKVDDSTGNKILQWYAADQAGCPSATGTCSVIPAAFVIEAGQWQIQTWGGGGAGPWSAPLSFNAPSLSGTWIGTITSYVRGTFAFGLTIIQNGSGLSGVLYDSEVGDIPFTGNILGNSANLPFSFFYQGYTVTGTLNLVLTAFSGTTMSGNYTLTECILGTCASDTGTFSLTKQ